MCWLGVGEWSEVAFGGGHGPGDSSVIRPYLMYGKVFLGGKLKVFVHASAEFYKGPVYRMTSMQIYSPPPRVNGPIFMDSQETESAVMRPVVTSSFSCAKAVTFCAARVPLAAMAGTFTQA